MVYEVEFYEEDVISKNSKPSLTYYAEKADSPQEAVVEAIKGIGGGIKKYNSGIVKNSKGRIYKFNPKTGKHLDSLEGRLN